MLREGAKLCSVLCFNLYLLHLPETPIEPIPLVLLHTALRCSHRLEIFRNLIIRSGYSILLRLDVLLLLGILVVNHALVSSPSLISLCLLTRFRNFHTPLRDARWFHRFLLATLRCCLHAQFILRFAVHFFFASFLFASQICHLMVVCYCFNYLSLPDFLILLIALLVALSCAIVLLPKR